MSTPTYTVSNAARQMREKETKKPESGTIPPRSKEQEIENLKRLLANVSQRLDALKHR